MKTTREFFQRNSVEVAENLLGHYIAIDFPDGKVIARIVETEAYSGETDLACHASRGKTERNKIIYGQAGHLYIYLNYGIFYLTNIVCDKIGFPSAVLIRSAEIIEGKEVAQKRVESHKFVKSNDLLATGPGKFSVAMGLDKNQNGIDLLKSKNVEIFYNNNESFDIIRAARVGVDYAGRCKDYPWRFYIDKNKYVSKKVK